MSQFQQLTPSQRAKIRSLSIAGLILGALFLIPSLGLAQPASNPPGGNVDAQFDTVTVGPGAFSVDSDGTVTNPGGTNSGNVFVDDGLVVESSTGHGVTGTTTVPGYFGGFFSGPIWGVRATTTDPGGIAGYFTGERGISVNSSNGDGINVDATNGHGIYANSTGAGFVAGIFRTATNIGLIVTNLASGTIVNVATPTNAISAVAPSGTGGSFSGSTAGGYFEDSNSTGYSYIGYGMRPIAGYGSNGGYFENINTGSNAEVAALQSGVEAYGNTQGGYFHDLTESGYARLGHGDYGLQAYGDLMGGYFQDSNNLDTYANVAYGGYGIQGIGTTMGGYFNDSNSSGYAYIGYGDAGVYGRGDSYGGYFRDNNATGYAYIGYGDRGLDATGSYTGGTFRNTSGVWADLASSGYSLITSSSIAMNSGQAYKPGGGSWASSSDIRLKDVEGDFGRGLKEILQLNPIEFRYKKDNELNLPSDEDYVGFVAQDVQKVIPEAISEGEKGYLFLDMHPLNVAVVNAIKEIVSMIDAESSDIRAELADQKREIEELKSIVCELKPEHLNCN